MQLDVLASCHTFTGHNNNSVSHATVTSIFILVDVNLCSWENKATRSAPSSFYKSFLLWEVPSAHSGFPDCEWNLHFCNLEKACTLYLTIMAPSHGILHVVQDIFADQTGNFQLKVCKAAVFFPQWLIKGASFFFFSFPLFETVVLCVPRREISNFGRDFAQAITIVTKLSHQLPCNTDCRSEGSRDLPVRGDSAVWHKMLWLQSQKQWIWPKEYYLQQDLLFLRPFFFLMKIFHKRCFSVP